MGTELHLILALASTAAVALVCLAAAVHAGFARGPDVLTSRAVYGALLLLVLTNAGGLALLLRGSGPRQPLHIMYGALVVAAIPLANAAVARGGPRVKGVAALIGALLTLVLIARLFMTG